MQITHSLPDLLGPNLRVFFVGDNPGLTTQSHGHHYSHKSNHFWPLLYESGLIDKPLKPIDDHLLPIKYRLGLSCLVSRATSSSHELGDQELIDGFKVMVNKINACNPQIVCFNGKGIFEKLTGKKLTRVTSLHFCLQKLNNF